MRIKLTLLALLFSTSLSNAQQVGPWSGFFVTGFGQYTGGTSTQRDNGFVITPATGGGGGAPPPPPPPPVAADGSYGLSGGFGGGGIGYNLQFDRFVVGLDGDIAGGGTTGSSGFCGTPAHTCGTRVNAMSDVRGVLGYSFGNVLPFVSGGLAVDRIAAYDSLFGVNGSSWRPGFVVGGGLSYKITPQLALTLEYLHTEINSASLFNIVPGVPERISVRSETARASLSYYFSSLAPAPVVARY